MINFIRGKVIHLKIRPEKFLKKSSLIKLKDQIWTICFQFFLDKKTEIEIKMQFINANLIEDNAIKSSDPIEAINITEFTVKKDNFKSNQIS